jgi:pimeloyl-ACP methyl ester carboxylesterase
MGLKGLARAVGALALTASAAFASPGEPRVTQHASDFAVQLRPGVTSVVTGTWFDCAASFDARHPSRRPTRTLVAVHGLSHTAATYAPLAAELCEQLGDSEPTSLLAIDLPGHGRSADPQGVAFSNVSVEDYAAAVQGVLEQLPAHRARPVAVLGHSLGGLVLQRVQARLLAANSSLFEAFGIPAAVMLAPVPSAEVSWPFADSGAASQILGNFITVDPVRGVVARIPAEVWPQLFFSTSLGVPIPSTPSPDELTALGYTADEPLTVGLQLTSARPSVPAGAFAPSRGTALAIISLSEDAFLPLSVHAPLYQHLTLDGSNALLLQATSPEAVHDLHVADPGALLSLLLGALKQPLAVAR